MAALPKGIFIVAAKRTPFGSFGGKLANKTSTDLQVAASMAAMTSGNVAPEIVDSVVVGNVISCSSVDGVYLARHVLLRCGIPLAKPALNVNRLCGSGFQSIVNGIHEITIGDSKVVLTGGAENMSQAPFAVRNVRFGTKLGMDNNLEDTLWASLTDALIKLPMGLTAENLAVKFSITREESDNFSLSSQQKWKKAYDSGYFKEEIAPMKIKVKGKEVEMDMDEHPKPETTIEKLGKLSTVFKKGGVVTAGSASGICDGASAIIIASESALTEYKLKPLARIVAYGVVGCDPSIMGIGPVAAVQKMLKLAGKTLNDMDLIEINEAFSAQCLACAKELKVDMNKLNVNGGAIALGHPLGASGSRITAHLVHELRRRGGKFAVGSACIGGGQGIAILLENV